MSDRFEYTMRLLGYLRPYQREALGAYLSMGVVTLLNLVIPAVLGWVVDVGLTPAEQRTAELVAVPDWLPSDEVVEAYARLGEENRRMQRLRTWLSTLP